MVPSFAAQSFNISVMQVYTLAGPKKKIGNFYQDLKNTKTARK